MVNVKQDLIGDWYRDPWNWPEFEYLASDGGHVVAERAPGTGVRRVANVDVPKENFSTRPAVVIEPVDRLLYQALTDRVSKAATKGLARWVYGWRLARRRSSPGVMARNDIEWDLMRSELVDLVGICKFGFKTDIVSCFASMPVARVGEEIEHRAGGGDVTARLLNMLQGWEANPGRKGLPQRSMASALLANMYLTGLDAVIHDYNQTEADRSTLGMVEHLSTRWMDDIWVFGQDDAGLRRIQVGLQEAARELDLELNSAKTMLLEGDELAEEALKVNHSAVDSALESRVADTRPLEDLLDELTERPESAERTSIHFAMVRMRKHKVKSRLTALVEVAVRMPHGADHLSRAFRSFGSWKHLMDWYVDYLESDWACFDWTSAQLGTMFPSKSKVSSALVETLESTLAGRPALPMFALCLQRLVRWSPDNLRDIIRDFEAHVDHPLERRLLALAALALHERRSIVRDLLGAYEEGLVTLRAIEARDFRPFPVHPDYG